MQWNDIHIRASSVGYLMTEPQSKADKEAGLLSKTAQKHLLDVYIAEKYGRKVGRGGMGRRKGWPVKDEPYDPEARDGDNDGIVQEGLKRTLFYFEEGGLSEVELQYDREGWDDARVGSWVSTIKTQADRKYGPGRLFADENGNENGLRHTLKAWMWPQNFVSLRLVHYTAQKGNDKMRRVSLHYCGQ
jgi:hypothetical protein